MRILLLLLLSAQLAWPFSQSTGLRRDEQVFPLNIRAYTGWANFAHPSVVKPPTTWNGWEYWMCATPYPPGSTGTASDLWRAGAENPSIYVSHDGINWFSGSKTNPVAFFAERTEYSYFSGGSTPGVAGGTGSHLSDGELYLRDDGVMNLYYRANNGWNPTTSSSSFSVGTGSKTFTVASGLGWVNGTRCRVYRTGTPATFMEGNITSYAGSSLQLNVDTTGGAGGPYTDWTVSCDLTYLVLRTSTDGVAWTDPVIMNTVIGGGAILAPQVTRLANGTVRMFMGNSSMLSSTIDYVDATDATGTAFTWTPVSTGISVFWHFDAKWRTDNEVWIITSVSGGLDPYSQYRLYVSGNNGASFSLVTQRVNPASGSKWDAWGYYKPDFLFNSGDAPITIDLYTDSGEPYSGSSRATEAQNAGFHETYFPYKSSSAWKLGLFKNLTVLTNYTPTTNVLQVGQTMPITATLSPSSTNWESSFGGSFYSDELVTRHINIIDRFDINGGLYLFKDNIPNVIKLGINNGAFWITSTNAAFTEPVMFNLGGDGVSGAAKDRAFKIYTVGTDATAYVYWGHSFGDTGGSIDFSANSANGKLTGFLVHATLSTFTDVVKAASYTVGTATTITTGTGTPESVVTAPVGSIFLRTDGGVSTTLYVKTSGSGNTGWTAK